MKTDNELIAEFLQWETRHHEQLGLLYSLPEKLVKAKRSSWRIPSKLEFHTSWDWLMPVYNKLTKGLDVAWKITSKGVNIHNHGKGFDGTWEVNCPENVIIDAYKAVVEFIKWYNQQKP